MIDFEILHFAASHYCYTYRVDDAGFAFRAITASDSAIFHASQRSDDGHEVAKTGRFR